MRNLHGGERGRAEAAHLLSVPPGALLRAALSEGGVGRPQSSMPTAAGDPGLGARTGWCAVWGLMREVFLKYLGSAWVHYFSIWNSAPSGGFLASVWGFHAFRTAILIKPYLFCGVAVGLRRGGEQTEGILHV